ncbi:hypothetical protein [Pasteurella sp. PK-2025]|uniref:hypothetical protein n=1 Tax=Pasteurella sp. PK-2025 TaxID=3413133 RepID=UPI003C73DA3C
MVSINELKNFITSTFCTDLFTKLEECSPNIVFNKNENIQMQNIFAQMLNNANLATTDFLKLTESDKERLIRYALLRLSTEIQSNSEDNNEDKEPDELISYSYDMLIIIQLLIEYYLFTNKSKDDFMLFLKKQRIPSAKKFFEELSAIFYKI